MQNKAHPSHSLHESPFASSRGVWARALLLALALGTTLGCTRKSTPGKDARPVTAFGTPDTDATSGTQSCDRFCAGFCRTCGGPCTCEMRQKPSQSRGYAGMGGKECLGVCSDPTRDGRSNEKDAPSPR